MKTIQLKLTKESIQNKNGQLVLDNFIQACINLDASIFEPFIKENQFFEDVDKYSFLQLMKERFERCKIVGIKRLTLKEATCKGCQDGHKTYEFFDESQMRFSFVVLYQDDEVSDIFQCHHSSSVFNEDSYPF